MILQEFLARLREPKRQGKEHIAFCPAHDDGKKQGRRSLSISQGADGRIILHCFAGCTVEDIVAALGLTTADLFRKEEESSMNRGKARAIGATYDYVNEAGNLLFQVVRLRPKAFTQRRPDGNGGWINNLDGVRRVLYRLPQVIEAVKADKRLYIAEGEKAVEALVAIGLPATCSPGGAGKWRHDAYAPFLKGAPVVILPDNDEPGRKHAETVARSLDTIGAKVRVLDLLGLPEKGDIFDWIVERRRGGKDDATIKAELEAFADQAPVWREADDPANMNAAKLLALDIPPLRWIIPGILPEGLSILAGKPKSGKSILALGWAYLVAKGRSILNAPLDGPSVAPVEEGDVLYLALEDSQRRFQERLKKISDGSSDGMERLDVRFTLDALDQGGLEPIRAWLKAHPEARLVVLDVLGKVLPRSQSKVGAYVQDYANMTGLQDLVRDKGVAMLVVHHTRKAKADYVFDEISGTTGISGCADTVMVLERKGKDDGILHVTGRDVDSKSLALRFEPETLTWEHLGDAKAHAMSVERKEIIDLLRKAGPMLPKDIAEVLEKNRSTIRNLLVKMLKDGAVFLLQDGRYTVDSQEGGNGSSSFRGNGTDSSSSSSSSSSSYEREDDEDSVDSVDSVDRHDRGDSVDRHDDDELSTDGSETVDRAIDPVDGDSQAAVYAVYAVYGISQEDHSSPCENSPKRANGADERPQTCERCNRKVPVSEIVCKPMGKDLVLLVCRDCGDRVLSP